MEEKKTADYADRRLCARCGREVSEEELASGKARENEEGLLCPDCALAQEAGEPASETGPRELIGRLDAILTELRNINRTLSFERFSIFNIFGGIFLGAALIVLFLAFFAFIEQGQTALILWGIALQLVALTFFLLGK